MRIKKGKDWKTYITDKVNEIKFKKHISVIDISVDILFFALFKVFIMPFLELPISVIFGGKLGPKILFYGFIILFAKYIFDDIFEIKKEEKE